MALKTKDLDQVRPDVKKLAATAKGERSQISFAIDKQIHFDWKMLALKQKVSLQQLILDAMTEYEKKLQ